METTRKPKPYISVWKETLDTDDPRWIVSLEGKGPSRTLDVCDTKQEAIDSAKKEADEKGLKVEID